MKKEGYESSVFGQLDVYINHRYCSCIVQYTHILVLHIRIKLHTEIVQIMFV